MTNEEQNKWKLISSRYPINTFQQENMLFFRLDQQATYQPLCFFLERTKYQPTTCFFLKPRFTIFLNIQSTLHSPWSHWPQVYYILGKAPPGVPVLSFGGLRPQQDQPLFAQPLELLFQKSEEVKSQGRPTGPLPSAIALCIFCGSRSSGIFLQ